MSREREYLSGKAVLLNLSGRGDKDMGTAIEYFGLGETKVDLDDDITEEPVG